jgi:hypothetical protein
MLCDLIRELVCVGEFRVRADDIGSCKEETRVDFWEGG